MYNISLASVFYGRSPVMDGCYQLGDGRLTLTKTMLIIQDDYMGAQMLHHMTQYNVFKYFTTQARKGNGPVISRICFNSFFENW